MKNKVMLCIFIFSAAAILHLATRAIPALQNSGYKDFLEGGSVGVMLVGIIMLIQIWKICKDQEADQ